MKKISFAVLCGATLLQGCMSPVSKQATKDYEDTSFIVKAQQAAQAQASINDANRTSSAKVNGIWLGGKSVPLAGDNLLPEAFRVVRHFEFPGQQFSLWQAAEKIQQISGINVQIGSDVFTAGSTQSKPISVTLNSTTSGANVLNQITLANGLSWDYRDGVATIRRYITRHFTLKSIPVTNEYSFEAGKTGSAKADGGAAGGSGSISTGFSAKSSITSEGKFDPLRDLDKAIAAVLSEKGKVTINRSTGGIIVTDTRDGIERAAKIIERENELLTRNATFNIQVISFTANESDEASMDPSIVFKNLKKLGASISSPSSLVNTTAGSIGVNVVTGNGAGRFDGSSAFLKMLAEKGTVSTVHNMDVRTKNLNFTPVSILNKTVYLAKTTAAPASAIGGTGGTPGLEPGTVTTGFTLALIPNILDSNQISLQFGVGMVDLLGMEKLSSGSGTSQQSIEAPTTGGFEFQQDVFLKPYETVILTGYERISSKYTRRGLSNDIPLIAGGSYNSSRKKEHIFIMITPTIVTTAN